MSEDKCAEMAKEAALNLPVLQYLCRPAEFYVDQEIRFLTEVEKQPILYEDNFVRLAIQRYETFWLPFVATHESKGLWVPLDIQWVWHCHLLSPKPYVNYCMKTFGKILVKNISTTNKLRTVQLWSQMYPDKELEVPMDGNLSTNCDYTSNISNDIEVAVQRQKFFNYQVTLPHFLCDKFLKKAVQRYKMFIYLQKMHSDKCILPTIDMDIVWIAHLQNPIKYKNEIEQVLNEHLSYVCSVGTESQGTQPEETKSVSMHLWQELFNEDYYAFGAMYRGKSTCRQLKNTTDNPLLQYCTKTYNVRPTYINLNKNGKVFKKVKHLTLCLKNKCGRWGHLYTFNTDKNALDEREDTWHTMDDYINEIEEEMERKCLVSITTKQNIYQKLVNQNNEITHIISLDHLFDDLHKKDTNVIKTVKDYLISGIEIAVGFKISIKDINPVLLSTRTGKNEDVQWPSEKADNFFGPVPLAEIPAGKSLSISDNRIQIFINDKDTDLFVCRVIHSKHLLSSVIQVKTCNEEILGCSDGTVLAIAHTIGLNELPLASQIESSGQKCITLEPKKGDRAMIIKNNQGDWALVKSNWTGVRKAMPAPLFCKQRGKMGNQGDPGFLNLLVHYIETSQTKQHALHSNSFSRNDIEFGSCSVDFYKGHIKCKLTEKDEVAEYIALAFCSALLHCYCQPYPPDFFESNVFSFVQHEKKKGALQSSTNTLLNAVGIFDPNSPTNNYLKTQIHKFKKMNKKIGSTRCPENCLLLQAYGLYNLNPYYHSYYEFIENNDDAGAVIDDKNENNEGDEKSDVVSGQLDIDQLTREDTYNLLSDFSFSINDAFGSIVSHSDADFTGGYEPFSSDKDSNPAPPDSIWTSSYDAGSSYYDKDNTGGSTDYCSGFGTSDYTYDFSSNDFGGGFSGDYSSGYCGGVDSGFCGGGSNSNYEGGDYGGGDYE